MKINFDSLVFCLFLGLYLLKADIPEFVSDAFMKSQLELSDKDHYIIYTSLKGAGDFSSEELRQMIIRSL